MQSLFERRWRIDGTRLGSSVSQDLETTLSFFPGIIDDPITLTVYGKNVPDLTLIDLPGLTKVAAAGSDQTTDVARVTREMTERYLLFFLLMYAHDSATFFDLREPKAHQAIMFRSLRLRLSLPSPE